jgi:flagellar biosynthesis protein FlhA
MVLGCGVYQRRTALQPVPQEGPAATEEVTSEAAFYKNIQNIYGLLNVEQIEMDFGSV